MGITQPVPETAAGVRVKANAAAVIDAHRGELVRKPSRISCGTDSREKKAD